MDDEEIYSRIIHSVDDFTQIRLTINRFRSVEYMHLRKYYMDFEGEWLPTKDGISMPLGITNSMELFSGLLEIISLAESQESVMNAFKDLIKDIYQ